MALASSHGPSHPTSRSCSEAIARAPIAGQQLRANRTDPGPTADCAVLSPFANEDVWSTLDSIDVLGLSLDFSLGEEHEGIADGNTYYQVQQEVRAKKPFNKWIKNLHRRAQQQQQQRAAGMRSPVRRVTLSEESISASGHRKSSSDSSFAYVADVRSASISLASASVVGRARKNTTRSLVSSNTDQPSRNSASLARFSEDRTSVGMDPVVVERLLQRRRILEELISTEESYIADVRFLMNVYVTILASLPTQHVGLRSSINRNLADIVELHEEILRELYRIVPHSEYTQPDHLPFAQLQKPQKRHRRHRSASLTRVEAGIQFPGMTADPSVVAEAALVFGRRMNRLFIYEEYGAKYEMMMKDVASAYRTMPGWEAYQKGLEALAGSVGSMGQRLDLSKKSLTIGDLLVKPIQRICRYPLLFAELLKHTPVCDCPNSHADIESVLIRLREATSEINRATNDPSVKTTMERTWLLQDRLTFPDQGSDAAYRTTVRSFGQIMLCGVLHACWQSKRGIQGHYMISLMYKNYLCLATTSKADQTYTIQACLGLPVLRIEEADNGRGLQCHTAPFSWKVVFEVDYQLYEIILTACGPKEETEWRQRLEHARTLSNAHDSAESTLQSSIFLDMKSLGTVFGKPGTVARRMSMRRAITVGPKSPMYQVIIKNTTTVRESHSASPNPSINRSQSLLATNSDSRIPVLAPSRGDRARLETMLADVWSHDVLPFPGISTRSRSEYLVRNSASSMMRKLSVASITNSFSKRNAALSSPAIPANRGEDDELPHVIGFIDSLVNLNSAQVPPERGHHPEAEPQRLSSIQDGPEQGSEADSDALSLSESALRSATISRNCEGLPDEKSGIRTTPKDALTETADLHPSSTNTVRIRKPRRLSTDSASATSQEKENVRQTLPELRQVAAQERQTKARGKWNKINALNRGLMGERFRSFFR